MVLRDYGDNTFAGTEEKKLELINILREVGKDKIHELFQLPDKVDVDGRCEVRDIKLSEETYHEYFDGMVVFIREVLSIDDNDTAIADKFNTALNDAKSKDKDFIDGLFRPACEENVSCISILKNNLEYICDMTATIERYKKEVNTITDAYSYSDSDVKTNSVNFMISSVNYFLQNLINNIDRSLDIMVNNKDRVIEKVDDRKFCLFI